MNYYDPMGIQLQYTSYFLHGKKTKKKINTRNSCTYKPTSLNY